MADRVTQLQDLVCQQASVFCDSVSYISEHANASAFPKLRKLATTNSDDMTNPYFASLITKGAKDIDVIISTLPDDIECTELQNKSMERIQKENEEITEILKVTLEQGEALLDQIHSLTDEINKNVMEINDICDKRNIVHN